MSLIPTKPIVKSFTNPVVWFGWFLFIYSFYNYSGREEGTVIRSDMRGYYAYLPAIFEYDDPSFQSNIKAEAVYFKEAKNQKYLVQSKTGSVHNKYFPGVAVLQAPFYLMAKTVSHLQGSETDGYAKTYRLFFQIGATFYALLGLLFFYLLLKNLFPDKKLLIQWLIPVLYVATPLFHYSVNTLSFSHSYSFFLFGLFAFLVLKLKESTTKWRFAALGLTLGMIALVRPTNLVIVLIIPFLLGGKEATVAFFKDLFWARGRHFILAASGFGMMLFLLLLVWKWESGSWLVWSYGGEGFNFFHPAIIASLFSFRVGLFVHTPVLILSIVGLVYLYRTHKFQVFWWSMYFLINAWIISSWWCWDYESAFGNRPYSEHLIFLLLPLFFVVDRKKIASFSLVGLFFIVGLIRLSTFNSGAMVNQRFTSKSYFESLAFWNSNNFERWNYFNSCPPFGKKINSTVLLEQTDEFHIGTEDLFPLTGSTKLHLPRTNERFYFRVLLDKQTKDLPLENVNLVVQAENTETGDLYYLATLLHNDRLEGVNEWSHLEFEGIIPDNSQKFNVVSIYLWNRGKQEFKVRNFKIIVEEYKS